MDRGRCNQRKRIFFSIFFLMLLGLMGGTGFADIEHYELECIQMDAVVDESHRIQVSEIIDAAFHQETEEVVRRIPLLTNGLRYELSDLQGEGVVVKPLWKRDEVILRIKKEAGGFYGKERFRLSYTLQGSAEENHEGDQLYLSVVPADWDTYIHQVILRVELPVGLSENMVSFQGISEGLAARETMAATISQNQITAESQFFLVPEETIFMQVKLPDHTFSEAVPLGTFYEETEKWAFGLMFGIVLMAFGVWIWSKELRKEPSLRMDPPYLASPSEIHYLFEREVENRDLSILLIEWANRGWIHLFPPLPGTAGEGAAISLERRPPSSIHSFELRFFNLLFDEYGNGQRVALKDLRGDFYRHLPSLRAHLASDFGTGEKAFYKNHETKSTIGLTIMASLPVFFFWIRVGMENYRGWIAGGLSLIIMVIQLIAMRWIETADRRARQVAGGLLLVALSGLAFYFERIFGFLIALAAGLLIIYLVRRSEKRTPYGIERIRQFLGYRSFLASAGNDQLLDLMHHSPELYFYGFPFAERMNVLEAWKNQFKEIFILSPIWYHGKESMDFSVEEFNREILDFLQAFETAMEAEI